MRNDEMTYERELKITDILARFFRSWRKSIVSAIIGAVLLAGYILITTINQEPISAMTADEIAAAEVSVKELEDMIKFSEDTIKENEDAIVELQSSMEANEYSIVDKENEIKRVEEAIEKSKELEEIYQTIINDMLTINVEENDHASEVMSFTVKLADVRDTIFAKESRIVTLNEDIREIKKANEITIPKQIAKIEEQMEELEKEIELLYKESDELIIQMEKKVIPQVSVTKVLIFAVLGFALGLCVSWVCLVIVMMFDDRIYNAHVFEEGFGLCLLGTIDSGYYAKNDMCTKVIGKVTGTERILNNDEEKEIIVTKIKTFSKTNKLMAIGTIDMDNIREVVDELKRTDSSSGIEFVSAGNPMYNVETLNQLKDYELILVEKVGTTKSNELLNLIRFLNRNSVSVIGIVAL